MKKSLITALILAGTTFVFAKSNVKNTNEINFGSDVKIEQNSNNINSQFESFNFENSQEVSQLYQKFVKDNPNINTTQAHFKCWLTSLGVYAAVVIFGGSSEDASYLMHLYRDTCNDMIDMAEQNNP